MNHDSQGQRRFALYTIWGTLRIMILRVSWGTLRIMVRKVSWGTLGIMVPKVSGNNFRPGVSWRVCMVRPRFRRAP